MQKSFLFFFLLFTSLVIQAQSVIKGNVYDEGGSPLSGVDVYIDGTDYYYQTLEDGFYELALSQGEYVVTYEFFGLDTRNQTISVVEGEQKVFDVTLSAPKDNKTNVSLEQITVSAETSQRSEAATINMQKKAVEVKEVVGAEQLTKQGVSEASEAVSKISGVVKNEGLGQVFIRGLGDRYQFTKVNGLPVPSDQVDAKNISLSLFPSSIIENVALSKTYRPVFYADFGAGNVDVTTKSFSGKPFIEISMSTGINTNILKDGVFGDYKTTTNYNYFGFYDNSKSTDRQFLTTNWNAKEYGTPINHSYGVRGGTKFKLFGLKSNILASINHSNSFSHTNGLLERYRDNILNTYYNDYTNYKSTSNTTGSLDLEVKFSSKNRIRYSGFLINKFTDELIEGGRNRQGFVFDQQPFELGAFLRDQRTNQNLILVNQLLGDFRLTEKVDLNWGIGYNMVNADEPNRTRNEIAILPDGNTYQFTNNTDFQSRKTYKEIQDRELNGYLSSIIKLKEGEGTKINLNIGLDGRNKKRDLESQFFGLAVGGIQFDDLDNINNVLNENTIGNGVGDILIRNFPSDIYDATLNAYAGYAELSFGWDKLDLSIGGRYERDDIELNWDVNNYISPEGTPRKGKVNREYNNFLPSLTAKYEVADNHYLRLSGSKTVSIPEFREFAPFEYVYPTSDVFRGNEKLEASEVLNVDLKWEFFPTKKQLISLSAFAKEIKDPINVVRVIAASGFLMPFNTGDKANVYGFEAEAILNVLKNDMGELNFMANATKMWTNQELFDEFQFEGNTDSELQGAADLILNASLSYETASEHPFRATTTYNYSSDRIFSLGNASSAAGYSIDNVIQKGFSTLDLVLEKELNDRLGIKFTAKNLLNPDLKLEQDNNSIFKPLDTDGDGIAETPVNIQGNRIIQSYKKGATFNISLTYRF